MGSKCQRHLDSVINLSVILISLVGLWSQVTHANYASDGNLYAEHTRGFKESRRILPRILEESGGFRGGRAGRYKRATTTTQLQTTKKPDGIGHLSKVTLELPLDSSLHLLDLKLNTDLISDGYFERTQGKNLEPIISKPTSHETDLCHYHGRIRGIPDSWAALSTCDGLRGVVFDGNEIHYLEPVIRNSLQSLLETRREEPWETIHLKDAHRLKNLTCGHTHSPSQGNPPGMMHGLKLTPREKRSIVTSGFEVPYNSGIKSRYVEMVIVVDKTKYQEMGSDLAKVILRTKDIANIVNALYVPLDIFVALVGVIVWTEQDAITISSKGDDTLSSFLLYRRERLLKEHPNDNAQLLTALEFEDGVVGKAMQGPICSYKYSGGVNSDHKSVVGIVATTIAHELGHNFGLSHDTEACKCNGPDSKCIMSASSSSNRTAHWSSCSVEAMKYAMDHGMDYCLRNKPRSLFEPSTCGNGFVEPGEDCDCGHPELCTNYCCNPHTCRLYSNATCAGGTCCDTDTCHYRAGGTVCRPEQSQCDLPEYCSGESDFCPGDVHMQDGLSCETKNGQAYCAGGECRTHSDQCELLWGPTGKSSADVCYQKNVNGSRHGHCGFDLVTQKYAVCARADFKCGLLQCEHHHEKLEFGYESVALLQSFFLNVGGAIYTCRSATTDFGLDVVDPGLVPDGAICGSNKMCMKQKCVSVDQVLAPFLCPNNCSGNGVCNNKGHCHCNFGHGGEACDSGGYGGSVESGPIGNPHGGASVFARALYVTFLGFIPLVAIISFYLYHAGDNFKKLFKGGRFVSRTQIRDKSEVSNGNAGGGGGRSGGKETNPSTNANIPNAESGTGGQPNGVIGTDLFGQYKGFSLSPIRHAPPPTSSATHINNNFQNTSNQNIQNVQLPPLPPIPVETETLVRNEKASFLQKTMGRGVSWKEPVASSAQISPDQDDVSNTSDTPLTTNQKNTGSPKVRPLSSPDALNDSKIFVPPKKSVLFGSTSALSRFAAAFPFVRSFSSEPAENQTSPRTSSTSLARQRSFNRDTLEISKPILQNLKLEGSFIPVANGDVDVVDSGGKSEVHRYENVPGTLPDGQRTSPRSDNRKAAAPRYANVAQDEPKKSPRLSLKTVDRVKNQAPTVPPPPVAAPSKPTPKVQRAQSMIQPNRNSVVGSGPTNYNSLRRSSRPTAPPPQPPSSALTVSVTPIHPPPPLLKPSLNSILKFSNNNPTPGLISAKAPIAKLDDSDIGSPISSGSSPSPRNGNSKGENIYDVIDEGIPEKVETLSTGSSDGGGNGLLSDIILEIESRNKESIYNSVDRRKKKREKLKTMPDSLGKKEMAESPRITVNPNFEQCSPKLNSKSPQFKSSPPSLHRNPVPAKPPPPLITTMKSEGKNEPPPPLTPPPSYTSVIGGKEMSPNISGKPTCAVNGIPKPIPPGINGTSPSYVAKINYFSTLGGGKGDGGMKPISSLSQALISAAADKEKEPIYAPGQLSSIRPTWSRKSSIGKGEGGIYSKPVATPTIPQIPGGEGVSSPPTSRSGSSSPTPFSGPGDSKSTTGSEKSGPTGGTTTSGPEEKQGYKSFNPYLTRPLTFSTFRPSFGGISKSDKESIDKCSSPKPNGGSSLLKNSSGGVGLLTSPVQIRSPSRLVTS